jgi:hypothetical protein
MIPNLRACLANIVARLHADALTVRSTTIHRENTTM